MITEERQKECRSLFFQKLNTLGSLTVQASTDLFKIVEVLRVPRNYTICQKGNKLNSISFLATGIAEAYFISESGKKVVTNIFKPGDIIWDYNSQLKDQPTQLNFKTIGNCEIVTVPYSPLQELSERHESIKEMMWNLVSDEILTLQTRLMREASQNTTQKYKVFLKEYAPVLELVSNKKIAEYLGVTEQGLCKVKAKLKGFQSDHYFENRLDS